MRMDGTRRAVVRGLGAALAVGALAAPASAATGDNAYDQTNLVSNVPGMALATDPNLVNAWGLSAGPTTPIWSANQGTGTSTLYLGGVGGVTIAPLVVQTTPAPTGTVFNPTTGFVVSAPDGSSGPARFLFATLLGNITGWNPVVPTPVPPATVSTQAQVAVHRDGAAYTGLTLATDAHGTFLYAANFAAGTVDVWDSSWAPAAAPGAFTDAMLPKAYSPFNVQVIGKRIFVAYAFKGASGRDEAGQGRGFVDVYNTQGRLIKRLISHGRLDSPWGLVQAPRRFGAFGGALLVGNFGNGRIHAYNIHTGEFLGALRDASGTQITIDGLWTLRFGNGTIGTKHSLLFSAGPNEETDGLFGVIEAHPAS